MSVGTRAASSVRLWHCLGHMTIHTTIHWHGHMTIHYIDTVIWLYTILTRSYDHTMYWHGHMTILCILTLRYWLHYTDYTILTILYWLYNTDYTLLTILYWRYYTVYSYTEPYSTMLWHCLGHMTVLYWLVTSIIDSHALTLSQSRRFLIIIIITIITIS